MPTLGLTGLLQKGQGLLKNGTAFLYQKPEQRLLQNGAAVYPGVLVNNFEAYYKTGQGLLRKRTVI